ncbi:glycerol-3-phosphate dehydrogenase [Candidatus Enterovibrio altilux]|uniref:Glycerol-3-phosphate dehydrogenase n=1 Tax=Candidatus Enterovibrio altilux TaxID=1927128 RepID=A0A291B9D3_9GAMM|nr:glycerol-3-phosphate dehydrogenase [Candidatus Enterovibrio luxaltus]ATF09593.1 Aerobic glycerol-3-phosphate dehydrogenase [Candidatus Enterovibrio luxaltus]
MTGKNLDIIVVGGGINGAGIAVDAAGRGLSVGLYEAVDFASATSSASSKLIHGGLRYLEHYEFRLVIEALAEREILLKKAPFLAWPMRFRLPHLPHLRPAWMIRIGLFLYDNLGKRITLPASKSISFGQNSVLKPTITKGFEYSDCWVDDARLVILNVMDAQERGAEVRNRCVVEHVERKNGHWHVDIFDSIRTTRFSRTSKVLVNAAGPWVKQFFDKSSSLTSPRSIRLIKGSHIIVPCVHHEPQSYILQNEDGRIIFVLPYLDRFSIIGTTDMEYYGDPRAVEIDDSETIYLLDVYNQNFKKQISTEDVVWAYSGVRPLCDDESNSPQTITRDYTLELDDNDGIAPILSVFGGKLTTYRKLADAALKKMQPFFPNMGGTWTAEQVLPGGEKISSFADVEDMLAKTFPWMDSFMIHRLATTYGSRVWVWISDATSQSDLGYDFGASLSQREIDYLMAAEYVVEAEDLLWRRTKLGLYLNHERQKRVSEYIAKMAVSDGFIF